MFRNSALFLFLLYSMCTYGSITVPELKYLENVKLSPTKLKLEGDSVRFEIKGKIPVESSLTAKTPRVKLTFSSSEKSIDFGELALKKSLAEYDVEFKKTLAFEPWMLTGTLELQVFEGKKMGAPVVEKKVLARGVIAPQLMVKLGEVYPDEPIPVVGLYITSGQLDREIEQRDEFSFYYPQGSAQLANSTAQQNEYNRLKRFLDENPEVISIKITGVQSPEAAEGKSSKLGMDRAESAKAKLSTIFSQIPDSEIRMDSRWNNWFDLRLLLGEYEGISTQKKDEMYAVLMSREAYLEQSARLRKIPGFSQVEKDLYPKLRVAKVEVIARPRTGLSMEQSKRLDDALKDQSTGNELSFAEWALAGEATNSLDEKASIYAKMTELYRSPLPYNNIAVVRMRQAQRTLDKQSQQILWDEADRLLVQAYRIEPNPYTLHNQGRILALRGEYWEAYKKLSEASGGTQNPDFVQANEALRGALDILRGDYKLATLRFDYKFTDPKDYFNKGLAFFLAGDFAKSNMAFEESVILGRDFGYGYYGLAMIAAESGQQEVALIQLKKAIDANKQLASRAFADPIFQEVRESDEFAATMMQK